VFALIKVVLGWYEGNQKVDLSDYVPSGTWDVVGCPGTLENKRDPGEQHNRSQITYTLKIRRKTLFYTVNLIIPCVLIPSYRASSSRCSASVSSTSRPTPARR